MPNPKKTLPKKKDIDFSFFQNFISTPAGRGQQPDEVEKLIKDLKFNNVAEAFGVMFAGVNSIKNWQQIKPRFGKTYLATINDATSSILNEVQQMKQLILDNTLSTQVAQVSSILEAYTKEVLDFLVKNGKTETESQKIDLTLGEGSSKSLKEVIEALRGVDDSMTETLAKLVQVVQSMEKVDISGIDSRIVQPLNGFTKIQVDEVKKSLESLSKVFTGETSVDSVIELMNDEKYKKMITDDLVRHIDNIVEMTKHLNELNGALENAEETKNAINALKTITADLASAFETLIPIGTVDLRDANLTMQDLTDVMAHLNVVTNEIAAGYDVDTISKALADITKLFGSKNDQNENTISALLNSINSIEIPEEDTSKKVEPINTVLSTLSTMPTFDVEDLKTKLAEMSEVFAELAEVIRKLPEIDKENNAATKSKEIAVMFNDYDKNMTAAKQSAESGNKKSKEIAKSYEETAKETSKSIAIANEFNSDEALTSIEGLGAAILAMGSVMIIGSLITARHPNFIRDAYRFGAALTVFTMMVVTPLLIIDKVVKGNSKAAVAGFGRLVFTLGITLLIGAGVYSINPNLSKYSKQFIVDMTLFMLGVMFALRLARRTLQNERGAAGEIAKLITRCALVMVIGALIVQNKPLIKAALEFGLVLGAFILLTLLPLRLYKVLEKDSTSSLQGISRLLITCTFIMLIGALFVQNENLVKNALKFGHVLMGFLFLVLFPIAFFSRWLALEFLAIKQISRIIVVATFCMLIGALFMTNRRLVFGALEFAGLLTVFIWGICLAIRVAAKQMTLDQALFVKWFGKTVLILAAVLMIGGVFMTNIQLAKGAIAFAVLSAAYVWVLSKVIRKAAMVMKEPGTPKSLMQFSLAVLMLTASLAIGAFVVKETGWNALLGAALIAGFTFIMSKIIIHIAKKNELLQKGTYAVMLMGVAVALMAAAFYIMHLSMRYMKWEELAMFGAGVAGIVAMMAIIIGIERFSKSWWKGPVIAMLMAVSIGLLGYAFKYVNDSMKDFKEEYLDMFAGSVAAMALIFGIIGIKPIAGAVALGAVVAAGMALVFMLLSESFKLITEAMEPFKWEHLGKLAGSVSAMGGIFGALGLISPFIAAGTFAAKGMAEAMSMLKDAFDKVNAFEYGDLNQKLEDMKTALDTAKGTFDFSLRDIAKFEKGALVGATLSLSVTQISRSFKIMHKALEEVDVINDIEKFREALTSMIAIFDQSPESPFNKDKMKDINTSARLTKKAVRPMVKTAARIMNLVSKFAAMQIPDRWDSNGNPVHYRKLSTAEFPIASQNIAESVKALVNGFADLYEDPVIQEMLKDYQTDPDTMIERMFNSSSSKVGALIRMTKGISEIVGNVAETIGNMASRMIPDRWNEQGKPIHYRQLKQKDYIDAANAIKEVLSTMLNGIEEFGRDHKALLEEFADDQGGWFGIGKNKNSTIGQSIRMSKGIGEIISNVAAGIANYAKLSIPDRWNEKGQPIHFKKITENDFTDAATNIAAILTTFSNAVKDVDFPRKTQRNIKRIVEVMSEATVMMADIAKCIIDYSSMKIPVYKENSLEVTGYVNFDPALFPEFAKNVADIINALPKAIIEGYDPKQVDLDKISEITKAYTPMGDMLVKMVEAIKGYSSASALPIYDERGNIKGYYPIGNFDTMVGNMATNIEAILKGLFLGLQQGYQAFLSSDVKDPKVIEDIISSISPISNILEGLIKGVQAYADLKIPKFKANGEPDGYYTLTNKTGQDAFSELFKKMENNITTILKGLMTAITNSVKEFDELKTPEKREELYQKITSIEEILKPISSIIDIVKNYSELKFPTGFDGNGKATGYVTLNSTTISAMQANMEKTIKALPNALTKAIVEIMPTLQLLTGTDNEENSLIDTVTSDFGKIGSFMKDYVFPTFREYAEFKIPTEFDKDGKPKKYFKLDSTTIANLESTISAIICAVPNSMKKAIRSLDFKDEDFNQLRSMATLIANGSSLLNNIYNFDTTLNFSNLKDTAASVNEKLGDLKSELTDTSALWDALHANVCNLFDTIDSKFVHGKFTADTRTKFIMETMRVFTNLKAMLNTISTFDGEGNAGSLFGMNSRSGFAAYKEKVKDFSETMYELYVGMNHLAEMNDTLADIDSSNAQNAYDMLNSINSAIDMITAEHVVKFAAETINLERYIKTVNSLDIRRVGEFTRMINTLNQLFTRLGSLDRFTDELANKLSAELHALVEQMAEAERVIGNADRLREERQAAMNHTLDRISNIMNQSLQVNVSSGSADVTTSAYETPKS